MYRPARGGRSCERFDGYKTINRIRFFFKFIFLFYLLFVFASHAGRALAAWVAGCHLDTQSLKNAKIMTRNDLSGISEYVEIRAMIENLTSM